jgi:hypothetical protein
MKTRHQTRGDLRRLNIAKRHARSRGVQEPGGRATNVTEASADHGDLVRER